jgi:hypothetical protein
MTRKRTLRTLRMGCGERLGRRSRLLVPHCDGAAPTAIPAPPRPPRSECER